MHSLVPLICDSVTIPLFSVFFCLFLFLYLFWLYFSLLYLFFFPLYIAMMDNGPFLLAILCSCSDLQFLWWRDVPFLLFYNPVDLCGFTLVNVPFLKAFVSDYPSAAELFLLKQESGRRGHPGNYFTWCYRKVGSKINEETDLLS